MKSRWFMVSGGLQHCARWISYYLFPYLFSVIEICHEMSFALCFDDITLYRTIGIFSTQKIQSVELRECYTRCSDYSSIFLLSFSLYLHKLKLASVLENYLDLLKQGDHSFVSITTLAFLKAKIGKFIFIETQIQDLKICFALSCKR